jgi:cytochrome c
LKSVYSVSILLVILAFATGCDQDMRNQPKYRTYRPSEFFEDGRSQRPPVEGAVPRGFLKEDELLYTGKINGKLSDQFPFEMTKERLLRGRERYRIFCSVCHDATGEGLGMIVRRGFKQPPSFHTDPLRNMPTGHFFDVMTNGFGTMADYAAQITPEDRWAIAGYIRVLQLSQHAKLTDVPVSEQQALLRKNQ